MPPMHRRQLIFIELITLTVRESTRAHSVYCLHKSQIRFFFVAVFVMLQLKLDDLFISLCIHNIESACRRLIQGKIHSFDISLIILLRYDAIRCDEQMFRRRSHNEKRLCSVDCDRVIKLFLNALFRSSIFFATIFAQWRQRALADR